MKTSIRDLKVFFLVRSFWIDARFHEYVVCFIVVYRKIYTFESRVWVKGATLTVALVAYAGTISLKSCIWGFLDEFDSQWQSGEEVQINDKLVFCCCYCWCCCIFRHMGYRIFLHLGPCVVCHVQYIICTRYIIWKYGINNTFVCIYSLWYTSFSTIDYICKCTIKSICVCLYSLHSPLTYSSMLWYLCIYQYYSLVYLQVYRALYI